MAPLLLITYDLERFSFLTPFERLVCEGVVLIILNLSHAEELWCVGRLVATAPSRLRRIFCEQ